jgi:hypothetical protein
VLLSFWTNIFVRVIVLAGGAKSADAMYARGFVAVVSWFFPGHWKVGSHGAIVKGRVVASRF